MEHAGSYGQFELLRYLARGQVTEVFLARDRTTPGPEGLLVVHRLLPEAAAEPRFVETFLNESGVSGTLKHPNIVQIYDLGELDGQFFVAMEYIRGGSLHELLDRLREPRLPLAESLYIVGEVCAGLQYAHSLAGPDGEPRNLVHRELNPRHILVSVDGLVKIADFGMANALSVFGVPPPGSPEEHWAFIAPEQRQGKRVDRRADIYSCGALLYRLVTGRPPGSPLDGTLVPPQQIAIDLPAAVVNLIIRSMAADPRARHPTCGALRRDIVQVASALPRRADRTTLSELVRMEFPEVAGWGLNDSQAPPPAGTASVPAPAPPGARRPTPDRAVDVRSAGYIPPPPPPEMAPRHDETVRGLPGAPPPPPQTFAPGYPPQGQAPPPAPPAQVAAQSWGVAGQDAADQAASTQELTSDELEELVPTRSRMWIVLLLGGIVVVLLVVLAGGVLFGPWSPLRGTSAGEWLALVGEPDDRGGTPAEADRTPKPTDTVGSSSPTGTGDASPPSSGDGGGVAVIAETPGSGDGGSPGSPAADAGPDDRQGDAGEHRRDDSHRDHGSHEDDSASDHRSTDDQRSEDDEDDEDDEDQSSSDDDRRAPGRTGRLFVLTAPYARVYLDGRLLGTTPIMNQEVPAGRHTLYLLNPSFPAHRMQIAVRAGQVVRVGHNFQTGD